MVLIPPFDDEHVIAGQGTVGMEIVRQHGDPFDAIFVEVGGGGLIAGISAYVKALWPRTKVIGVEPTIRRPSIRPSRPGSGLPWRVWGASPTGWR